MLDADALAEIWATLARHKLRTTLTALSVAWGVFVLILLLGAGAGLEHGAVDSIGHDAVSSVWISEGVTSIPFAGQGPGRRIKLQNADYEAIMKMRPDVDYVDAELNLMGDFAVRYRSRRSNFIVRGAVPDVRVLENAGLRAGRFLDDDDVRERRKVAVIGPLAADVLFGKGPAIGEYIQIRGSSFRVVGIYDDPGGEDEQRFIYVPVSVVQLLDGSSSFLQFLAFTVTDADPVDGDRLVTEVRHMLASRHHFDSEDPRAARIYNSLELAGKVRRMFVWIRAFVWLVGIGTLLAGIVGVSNIMLISVKERTKEIGLRKAIGARPAAIVRMIVGESLVMTAVAGYLGLAGGIGVIALAARVLPPMKYLREPSVDFHVALGATLVIVISGTLAGLFPARQAAAIQPIEALRSE